jgi:hypothetical protein
MRKIMFACGAASLLALSGCVSMQSMQAERGHGTSRVFHSPVDQALAAAMRMENCRYALQTPGTRWRCVRQGDAVYVWSTDIGNGLAGGNGLAVFASPTDANGDTKVEILSKFYPAAGKIQQEAQFFDQFTASLNGTPPPPLVVVNGAQINNRALELRRARGGGAPAQMQITGASPEPPSPQTGETSQPRAPADSDVDHPRRRLPQDPKSFAVIIGVEKYSNDLPDAKYAEHDAAAVRASLVALGCPERNIKFLTGARATKSNLEAYIEDWLPRNVKPDSKVFIYFSGHGAPDPQSSQAYLVPIDGDPNYLDKTAYPVKKLYASLNKLKAKQIIVALDSCFSGAGGRSVLAEGARPLVSQVDASVSRDSKITLFAAASPREITSTLKEQGHGMFTYYFLKGLEGAAADDSGSVTAQGLYDYLKPQVQDAASRQNRDQTPLLEGVSDRELVRFK